MVLDEKWAFSTNYFERRNVMTPLPLLLLPLLPKINVRERNRLSTIPTISITTTRTRTTNPTRQTRIRSTNPTSQSPNQSLNPSRNLKHPPPSPRVQLVAPTKVINPTTPKTPINPILTFEALPQPTSQPLLPRIFPNPTNLPRNWHLHSYHLELLRIRLLWSPSVPNLRQKVVIMVLVPMVILSHLVQNNYNIVLLILPREQEDVLLHHLVSTPLIIIKVPLAPVRKLLHHIFHVHYSNPTHNQNNNHPPIRAPIYSLILVLLIVDPSPTLIPTHPVDPLPKATVTVVAIATVIVIATNAPKASNPKKQNP